MARSVVTIFFSVLLVALMAGCSSSDDKEKETGAEKQSVSAKMDLERWNAFVSLSNQMTGRFMEGCEKYFETFGTGHYTKPQGDTYTFTRSFYNQSSGDTVEAIHKKIVEFVGSAPKDEFEKTVAATSEQFQKLHHALSEAYTYYKAKEYIDDDYAKGAALHKDITAAYAALEELAPKFQEEIHKLDTLKRQQQLIELKKKGLKIRAAMLQGIEESSTLIEEVIAQGIDKSNIQSLNMEKFRGEYDKLAKVVTELEGYIKDEEQKKKEQINDYTIKEFTNKLRSVKEAAASLIEAVQKGKEKVSADPVKELDNKRDLLIDFYNRTR